MNKIYGILEVIKIILIPLVIINLFVYLCGAFIAWDINPMSWSLFTTTIGRICFVILELCILVNIPKFWDEFN